MPKGKEWIRKSEAVKSALVEDIMRSVARLFPDLLAALPVLLYQGAPHAAADKGTPRSLTCHATAWNDSWPLQWWFCVTGVRAPLHLSGVLLHTRQLGALAASASGLLEYRMQ